MGLRKRGVFQVRANENSIEIKDGSFTLVEGMLDNRGHFIFKVFPSRIFSPTQRPFNERQSFELLKNLLVFYNSRYSICVYFKKTVKVYLHGYDLNHHIATPATDFVLSFGSNIYEAVKELRSYLKLPDGNTIGTYVLYDKLTKDMIESLSSFGGKGVFVNSKKNPLKDLGVFVAGKSKDFDLNVINSWRFKKYESPVELLIAPLYTKFLASNLFLSPVYLKENFEIENQRGFIEWEMARCYNEGVPPVSPVFFYYTEDRRSWYEDSVFIIGENLLCSPSFYGERVKTVYLPGNRWMNLDDYSLFKGGNFVRLPTDVLYLKENSVAVYTDEDIVKIRVYLREKELREEILGRMWVFRNDGVKISGGCKVEKDVELLVRTDDQIKEVSFSLRNEGSLEIAF